MVIFIKPYNSYMMTSSGYSHVAPGGYTALIDAVGQVDQLAVVVMEVAATEGLIHTLASQGHGQAVVQGQQTQEEEAKKLRVRGEHTQLKVAEL